MQKSQSDIPHTCDTTVTPDVSLHHKKIVLFWIFPAISMSTTKSRLLFNQTLQDGTKSFEERTLMAPKWISQTVELGLNTIISPGMV